MFIYYFTAIKNIAKLKRDTNKIKYIYQNSSNSPNFIFELTTYNTMIDESKYIVQEPIKLVIDYFNVDKVDKMCDIALNSLLVENAGGASDISEAWSIHHLSEKLNSTECFFEMEIDYIYSNFKKVDYIIKYDNQYVGVSVTRALCHHEMEFTINDAERIINSKINGLILSRRSVVNRLTFYKSILHIWSPSKNITDILNDYISSKDFNAVDMEIIGTLDIWITESSHKPIYDNSKIV